jgi:excisionase family DNA binding protein
MIGMDTATAARILEVTQPTVRRWFDRGILTGWRSPGGWRRVDPETVAALAAQMRTASAARGAAVPED